MKLPGNFGLEWEGGERVLGSDFQPGAPSVFPQPGGPGALFPARHVDIPRFPALGRPDDSLPLHLLDDAGRPVEADLEAPLEHRDRSASRPDHLLDRLAALLVPRWVPPLLFARKSGDGGLVFGRALRPKMGDDALDLPLPAEGAVGPQDPPHAGLG